VKAFKTNEGTNVCPGPNIAYFSEIVSLQKMVDHIYGRANIIRRQDRPHMFVKELMLYVDYWKKLANEAKAAADQKRKAYALTFQKNLLEGITYYRDLADKLTDSFGSFRTKMADGLEAAEQALREASTLVELEPMTA